MEMSWQARHRLCRCRAARPRLNGPAPPSPRRSAERCADRRRNRFSAAVHSAAGPPFSAGRRPPRGMSRSDTSAVVGLKKFVSSSSGLDFVNALGACLFEEFARALDIKLRIAGLDAEKKAVAARELEPLHVKDRMVRHGQTIERQHSKERK